MQLKLLIIICFLITLHHAYPYEFPFHQDAPITKNKQKYVIGPWPGGMGSCLYALLGHLTFCNKEKLIPVAFWQDNTFYYDEQGFNGSTNVWEYYFKPLSELRYEEGDIINGCSPATIPYYYNPWKIDQKMRDNAHNLLTKYNVTPNNIVQQKIDDFYHTYIAGKHTIAIHVRGTDKFQEEKPIKPKAAARKAIRHASKNTQFFIASDEEKILNELKQALKGKKVIQYDCYRSLDGKPLHIRKPKPSLAQLGEDVVVEMYLMSMCDLLVHTISNVSTFALFLNPKIPNIIVRKSI